MRAAVELLPRDLDLIELLPRRIGYWSIAPEGCWRSTVVDLDLIELGARVLDCWGVDCWDDES